MIFIEETYCVQCRWCDDKVLINNLLTHSCFLWSLWFISSFAMMLVIEYGPWVTWATEGFCICSRSQEETQCICPALSALPKIETQSGHSASSYAWYTSMNHQGLNRSNLLNLPYIFELMMNPKIQLLAKAHSQLLKKNLYCREDEGK